MPRTNALHSAVSPDWCTPLPILVAARRTMGGIDLDPASCAQANTIVAAKRIYTAEQDGLTQPWRGRVFLNPPGTLVREFWMRLVEHWMQQEEGEPRAVSQAIWIGYSLEQLQYLQNIHCSITPLDFPLCVPKKRIKFYRQDGAPGNAPTHANYIAYLGPFISKFITEFSHIGGVS